LPLLRKENSNTLESLISFNESKNSFTYEQVGEVIEYLVEDFYRHKFSKLPFSAIDKQTTRKILNDTVRKKKILSTLF
jgi:hypothetical protein